jgi:hypothetical protein
MDTALDIGKPADRLQLHGTKNTVAIQEKCARQRFLYTAWRHMRTRELAAKCYSEPTEARPSLAST